jgi:hypothetical protein
MYSSLSTMDVLSSSGNEIQTPSVAADSIVDTSTPAPAQVDIQ